MDIKKFCIVFIIACGVLNIKSYASNSDNLIKENAKLEVKKIFKKSSKNIDNCNTLEDIKIQLKKGEKEIDNVYKNIKFPKEKKENINNAPIIFCKDKEIIRGKKFNPMDGVEAIDKEDGNISKKICILYNDVNVNKEGVYKIKYEVKDTNGIKREKVRTITVVQNDKPIIIGADNSVIDEDEKFNPLKGVRAIDKEDGDITKKIKVIEVF